MVFNAGSLPSEPQVDVFESVTQLTELAPGRQSFKSFNKDVEVGRSQGPVTKSFGAAHAWRALRPVLQFP